MKINLINGASEHPLDTLITSRLREALDGEQTLSFTAAGGDIEYVTGSTLASYDGQYYDLVSFRKSTEGQMPTVQAQFEHVSYRLNDSTYDLDNFVYSGTKSGCLAAVLEGTPFTAGTVEPTGSISVSLEGASRRAILVSVAALMGGEIEYDGWNINIVSHRGSSTRIELTDTFNVTGIAYSVSERDGAESYDVSLGRKTALACGDEIHIGFDPLGIDANTRIIAIEYNPYNTFDVSIDVGDYIPDIVDAYVETEERTQRAQAAASAAQATADAVAADYVKDSEVNAKITSYVDSTAGKASIVSALSGTYTTGTEVENIISQEISETGGSIKLYVEGKGYITQTSADGRYTQSSQLSAGISAYIDTTAGTSKIVSACSGTYQTISGMSAYSTTTQMESAITQEVSSKFATLTLSTSASTSGGQTTSTIKLKSGSTDLGSSVTISATTATQAATIAADAVNGIELSVATTASNNQTTSTITMKNGTTTIDSVQVTGTTATQAATIAASAVNGITLSVATTTSNNQTTSTITMKNGTTTIDSAQVTGTTAAQAASIAADAVNGITMSVTNGTSSSTITLKNNTVTIASGTIQFTGVVTFSDLSTAQTTTSINGANIRTGTISADRIDVDSLKVKTIYGEGTYSSYIMMASSGNTIYIGGDRSSYSYDTIFLKASTKIVFGSWGSSYNGLTIDSGSYNGAIYPNYNTWAYSLGTSAYGFSDLYVQNIYVGKSGTYGLQIKADASGGGLIKPATSSATYRWFVGNSSYPFYSGAFENCLLGTKTTSEIGFFGAGYVSRQTLSTTSDNMNYSSATSSNYLHILNNIAGILKKYGLIAT